MVVNCYRLDYDIQQFRDNLREHRNGADVVYAFMDYDQSIQLPLDVSVKECRRSSDEACMGSHLYKPEDVCLGEPEYNPFAFDVAMLGNMFRAHLSVRPCFFRANPRLTPPLTGGSSNGPGLTSVVRRDDNSRHSAPFQCSRGT